MMRGEGGLFFLHLKIYTEVMVFPQAQWKVRVNETEVILIIIQRRTKCKIWSAQLSYFNFLTFKAKPFIFLLCV